MAEKEEKDPSVPVPKDHNCEEEIEKEIEAQDKELLEDIPPDKVKKIISIITAKAVTHYQGPLPRPEDIAVYNEHIPNGGERIMKMAEDQSKHRIGVEDTVISSQQKQSERGQIFGFIIGILGIVSGVFLACMGHDAVGGVIAGATVVSLVSVFVLGKASQRADLKRKEVTVK